MGKYLVLQGYSGSAYYLIPDHYGAPQPRWHAVKFPLPNLTHLTTTLTYFRHALPNLDQLMTDYNCFDMLFNFFYPT
jgi:N-formylglutamate amidohydrolase